MTVKARVKCELLPCMETINNPCINKTVSCATQCLVKLNCYLGNNLLKLRKKKVLQ